MDFDVAVIGAGPAGSTAARECTKAGLRTVLVEKEKLPRFKPCGGGLTAKTLKALGFIVPKEYVLSRLSSVRLHYKELSIRYDSEETMVTTVERDGFDKLLADKAVDAGATLLEGTNVVEVKVSREGCEITAVGGDITTSVVIGADGVNSTVAKNVRPPFKPEDLVLAYEAEVPSKDAGGSVCDIYFDCGCMGYGWVFPKGNHTSVGLGGVLSGFRDSRRLFNEHMRRVGYNGDVDVHVHLIPIGSNRTETVSDRVILVGDAAGFAEPLTGEGIYYAIRSGQLAAKTITEAQSRGDYSEHALQQYETAWRSEFGEEFRRSRKAMRGLFMAGPLSMRILFSNKEIIEKFSDIQAGRMTYKEFKNWFIRRTPHLMAGTAVKMVSGKH
ncbi:MAG: NAD(P)/FAD-dependent oxidoreductase [Candidatus Altiarchaeota archaeon]